MGKVVAARGRRRRAKTDRHAMLALLHDRGTVQSQQFTMSAKIGRRHKQVERMSWRQERILCIFDSHREQRVVQQFGEARTGKGRFEPAPSYKFRNLAAHLVAGLARHAFVDGIAGSIGKIPDERAHPWFGENIRIWSRFLGNQLFDIGVLEPELGQGFQAAPRIYRLRQEHGIDPTRTCPGDDIGEHPQAQAMVALNAGKQCAIDSFYADRSLFDFRMEGAAGTGELPDLFCDAMHIDRQADPSIANQRYPEFFLPHLDV